MFNPIERARTTARVSELGEQGKDFFGTLGIAHTRWATHGKPDTQNAHPHISNNLIAVVHNGIIENYEVLRTELSAAGYIFTSETDTEVIAHLIHQQYVASGQKNITQSVKAVLPKLFGAYAIGVIAQDNPNTLVGARVGSPLVVALGDKENFLASDALALAGRAHSMMYLEEGMLYAALYMVFCAKLNDSIEIFRTYPFSGVPMCMVFSNNQANMNAKDRIKFFGWLQTATRNIKQFLTFAPLRGVAPSVGGAQRMHSRRKRTMKGGAVDDDITDGLNFADVYVVAHAAQNELVNTLPPCERLPGPVVEARGGTQRKTRVRHHGRSFVVRDGPRGGRYIMVAGKKIYQM